MSTSSSSGLWSLLLVAWLVALLSSLSALFIGEVMGQAPCVLCWFQRAFMFPLTVILTIACYRSDFAIWRPASAQD
ncbi:Disulfide bond formation protein C [compost metagenome]